jgi:RND family efflux transporter MFP subunit
MTEVLIEEKATTTSGGRLDQGVLAIGAIGVGVLVALLLVFFKATPDRAKTQTNVLPVLASTIHPEQKSPSLIAYGTVLSAREIVLQAEVSGRVISVHPNLIKGGMVPVGEVLFEVEDTDYVAQRDSAFEALKQAELSLELELGQQTVAKREWSLLGQEADGSSVRKELALRIPHKEQKEAALKSAQSRLKQAELNVARTRVKAPFNALILSESIDIGSTVNPATHVARISDADTFHINVRISYAAAQMLKAFDRSKALQATLEGSSQDERKIEFIHAVQSLDASDRMVQLLFAVQSPLGGHSETPVLLGDYVALKIKATHKTLVYPIPNNALYENNSVWAIDDSNQLKLTSLETVFAEGDTTYALAADDLVLHIVTSLLTNPLNGTAVSVQNKTAKGTDG